MSVLLLADDCNPEWPSLPIVGYKYALALARVADVTVATHVRNRPNIEKAAPKDLRFVYLDNEYVAAPMYKIATWLRGGNEVAWSTGMIMGYLPYLAFEREVWRHFRDDIEAGRFDIVHRITPMSPTMPSLIASKLRLPFVIGPLNGNLAWPPQFRGEQKREKERLRALRSAARYMPFARQTWGNASLVLAGFEHTITELRDRAKGRIVNFPEVGYDPAIFHARRTRPAFAGPGPYRFLYVGRLVPYKVPEVAVRAFLSAAAPLGHRMEIVGDGPEMPRLREICAASPHGDRVVFHGKVEQARVADLMREADAFVFPSIRELGAGVVIEAMACGMTCLVTDYGAPGHLAGSGRGYCVPIGTLDQLVAGLHDAITDCLERPEHATTLAAAGQAYAERMYTWDRKAELTLDHYEDVVAGRPVQDRGLYD